MKRFALIVALLALPAAGQGRSIADPVFSMCEGAVCYLRCSGNQTITAGTLAITAEPYSLFLGTSNLTERGVCFGTTAAMCNTAGGFTYNKNSAVWSIVGGTAVVATTARFQSGAANSFQSSVASGSYALTLAIEGARVGIGPDTYLVEEGTRIRASAGVDGTAGSGVGYTVNQTSVLAPQVHKITITNAALTAVGLIEDETIWTVPAKTRVTRIIVDVTAGFDDAAGPITAVTITCGPAAASAAYVASSSVFTINTIGDVAAEIGAGLLSATYADIPSFSATTEISCRFTATGGNLSTLTTGSATVYIEHEVYP